eukprot:GFKZ01015566.1.p1 GENE.GFKZ01015566.1~~GFKZ01015566.1.p1  ORF type:complete len:340 (+),score=63.46 GFKZ01015566.1:227-1246(+)
MSWPWNAPQSHLFQPPPPLPPPPMPSMGFPNPHPYPQQPLHIPFGSFSAPHQPHHPPPPPPPHFFNQPPSEYGAPSELSPYSQPHWVPPAHPHMMPAGANGHLTSYQQQPQMSMRWGRSRADPRRKAQAARRKNGLGTNQVIDGFGGARTAADEPALGELTRVKGSGGVKGSGKDGDGSMRDAALSKAVLDKLGARLPRDEKEIERWVAERKRNWPSRANVERKKREKEEKEKKGALQSGGERKGSIDKLREEYGSSEEDDGMKKRGKRDGGRQGELKKRRRGRARGVSKGGKVAVRGCTEMPGTRRQSLLRRLLEKEIRKETSVLLQAFKYLASRDAA